MNEQPNQIDAALLNFQVDAALANFDEARTEFVDQRAKFAASPPSDIARERLLKAIDAFSEANGRARSHVLARVRSA